MSSQPTTALPGGKPSSITLGTVWLAVRRHSLVVALFVILAAVAGSAIYFFLPLPKNTAYAIFHIAPTPTSVLNRVNTEARFSPQSYRQYQMVALKSKVVINNALSDPEVANLPMLDKSEVGDPVKFLMNNLEADGPMGPEFMRVYLEGDDPDQMVRVLKAISSVYLREVVNKDRAAKEARLTQLQDLHDKYENILRSNRQKIRDVQEALGSGDPIALQMKSQFLEAQLGAATGQLNGTISSLRDVGVKRSLIGEIPKPDQIQLPDEVIEDYVRVDPSYQALERQRRQVMDSLEETTRFTKAGVKTPAMEKYEKELERINNDLKELPSKLKPEISDRLRYSIISNDRDQLTNYEKNINALKALQRQLEVDIDDLIKQKKSLAVGQIDMEGLRREIAASEKIADRIVDEIETIKPELDAPTRVSMWEEPTWKPGIEGNRRVKYTGMAAGGILALGLMLVTWLEFSSRRIQTVQELSDGLGLRVVGTVPRIPRGGNEHHRRGGLNWQHLLTESVDTTRTMLLSGQTAQRAKSILVASAISGEGKTSISTHLAVSLARAGLRVLLIDGDMRRPNATKALELKMAPGLAEVLTGKETAENTIQTCRIPGLHVISAGTWSPDAASALPGETMDQIIKELGTGYDFVVLDSPPILPVADALAIAHKVDGVILSVMKDVSRYNAVEAACHRLSLVGANILGVVFSGVEARGYNNYYYYYDPKYVHPEYAGSAPAGGNA